jgi:hypothetical protein
MIDLPRWAWIVIGLVAVALVVGIGFVLLAPNL